MKRFLIFVALFPVLAVAGLLAWISIEIESLPDSPELYKLFVWAYVVCAVPALVLAAADIWFGKTRIPAVAGTALLGYAMAFAVALWIFDHRLVARILTISLAGGIPAAICSWLSNRRPQAAQ